MKEKEHQSIEQKESWQDEYLKWICGYANTYGGTIYIGTDDDGNVVGIDNARDLLERIPNKITDTMGIIADVNLLYKGELEYLQIRVYETFSDRKSTRLNSSHPSSSRMPSSA